MTDTQGEDQTTPNIHEIEMYPREEDVAEHINSSGEEIQGQKRGKSYWVVVGMSVVALLVGESVGILLSRYYFAEGGSSPWLRTLLACVGWPILLLPVLFNRHRSQPASDSMDRKAIYSRKHLMVCGAMGLLVAADVMLYTWGLYYLPVSTFSLLCSSELAFNAVFAFVLVRQRISPYIVNSIVMLTFSAILLGVQSSGERPEGVKKGQYVVGFVCTIVGSAVLGLILPLMQIVLNKFVGNSSFGGVLETQACIYVVATVVCVVGLVGSGEVREVRREANTFRSGKVAFYMTLIWSALGWQMSSVGMFALTLLVSSLFTNVVSAVTVPLVPIVSVFFFNDELDALKVIAMLLGVWGFVSYAFGGYKDSKAGTAEEDSTISV
eukprot:Gb_18501 [translate_table: standard]